MAHAVVQGLIPLAAVEDRHIVAAAAGVLQHCGVAGAAGAVVEPLAVHGPGGGDGGGVGRAVALRQALQVLALLIGGQDGVGGLLGRGQSGGLLLVGGVNGVAVGVGLGLRQAGDGDISAVDEIVAVLVLLVVGGDLVLAVDEVLIRVLVGVLGGQEHVLGAGLVDGGGHGGPVDGVEVLLIGVAVLGGGGLHGADGGVQRGLILLVQGKTGLIGRGYGGVDKAHGVHGLLLEVVVPGLVLGVALALQGYVGVQRAQGRVEGAHFAVEEVLVGLPVVVGGLRHGVALPVDGNGGLAALDDAGVVHHKGDGHHHEDDGNGAVEEIGFLFSGPLLCRTGGLGVHRAAGQQLLTLFLFSGCAHFLFIPSKIFCPPRRAGDGDSFCCTQGSHSRLNEQ